MQDAANPLGSKHLSKTVLHPKRCRVFRRKPIADWSTDFVHFHVPSHIYKLNTRPELPEKVIT